MDTDSDEQVAAEFQPLYAQVKAMITRRIATGEWKPGAMIPNEFQLAAEYNVSQGTVRKALIALEAERLIVRQQGRGTYVARQTRERALFHFFRLVDSADRRVEPWSQILSQKIMPATSRIAKQLEVERGTPLHAIARVRSMNALPAIFEKIYTPARMMPDLALGVGTQMIDEMYVIYQERYGITIAHASERLTAVAATVEDARLLDIVEATPLLEIVRIARDVGKTAVELRISRCRTDSFRYTVELS